MKRGRVRRKGKDRKINYKEAIFVKLLKRCYNKSNAFLNILFLQDDIRLHENKY